MITGIPHKIQKVFCPLFNKYSKLYNGHSLLCLAPFAMSAFDYTKVDWNSVFNRISKGPRGIKAEISRELGIDQSMLGRIWRRHQADPNFDPTNIYWGCARRKFLPKEEKSMAAVMIDDLASAGMSMPEKEIRRIASDHYSITNGRPTRRSNFQASNGWIYRFKNRHHLSGRVSQKERKKEPSQEDIDNYLKEMKEIYEHYPKKRIFNCDETPVRVAPEKMFTTQRIGKETPSVHRNGGVKDCVTAVATITANGQKWPLGIVAKGTTPQVIRNLDLPDDVRRYFSPSGKVNESIAIDHVDQISVWADGQSCALLWDSYGAHMTEKVKKRAQDKSVRLVMIPKNATATCQPLDFGVFGEDFTEVSERHKALLREQDVFSD